MSEAAPWRDLPNEVGVAIAPALEGEATAREIIAAIALEVPEYARPLEGSFGRGVRTGVGEALRQFQALVEDPSAGIPRDLAVYRQLGRGEVSQGRTLDSLQAAYRIGARVAWRRVGEAAQEAGLSSKTLSLLAESIFVYIDQLASASVDGYAEALREREGERQRRRRLLAALLLRSPGEPEERLREAATAASWEWPRTAATVVCTERDLDRLRPRLPHEALVSVTDETATVILADPEGPGAIGRLEGIVAGARAALGSTVSPTDLAASQSLALAALRASRSGAIGGEGLVIASEHLGAIMLNENAALLEAISRRRLIPLSDLSPAARERMELTALAYIAEGGNAAAIGRRLNIHPQTARQRIQRLRELLGDQLDDPAARFEMEAALRSSQGIAAS